MKRELQRLVSPFNDYLSAETASKNMLKSPKYELEKGFTFAYKTLLHNIVEGNEPMIDTICENNLAETIVTKLENLAEKGYTFEVLNEKNHTIDLELTCKLFDVR